MLAIGVLVLILLFAGYMTYRLARWNPCNATAKVYQPAKLTEEERATLQTWSLDMIKWRDERPNWYNIANY